MCGMGFKLSRSEYNKLFELASLDANRKCSATPNCIEKSWRRCSKSEGRGGNVLVACSKNVIIYMVHSLPGYMSMTNLEICTNVNF